MLRMPSWPASMRTPQEIVDEAHEAQHAALQAGRARRSAGPALEAILQELDGSELRRECGNSWEMLASTLSGRAARTRAPSRRAGPAPAGLEPPPTMTLSARCRRRAQTLRCPASAREARRQNRAVGVTGRTPFSARVEHVAQKRPTISSGRPAWATWLRSGSPAGSPGVAPSTTPSTARASGPAGAAPRSGPQDCRASRPWHHGEVAAADPVRRAAQLSAARATGRRCRSPPRRLLPVPNPPAAASAHTEESNPASTCTSISPTSVDHRRPRQWRRKCRELTRGDAPPDSASVQFGERIRRRGRSRSW
jgi:hypothetical protein